MIGSLPTNNDLAHFLAEVLNKDLHASSFPTTEIEFDTSGGQYASSALGNLGKEELLQFDLLHVLGYQEDHY